ncbi:MAG: thioredoxin [Thermodesulfobacteriota bacterium]|nr:thioredoxin [Thermodesulfobacteriota bacterium]|tara:strand:+ start:247 stop:570 length:324 start_codon:yes stop_codon:yes gene_type:complete
MSTVVETTDDDFQKEVLDSDIPVLVDFWAPWCGPCKMLAPTLEEISRENNGKIKIVKINIDENQEMAGKFGIRSIPTMMIFNKGELKNQIVGSLPKEQIEKIILEEI